MGVKGFGVTGVPRSLIPKPERGVPRSLIPKRVHEQGQRVHLHHARPYQGQRVPHLHVQMHDQQGYLAHEKHSTPRTIQ